MLLFFYPVFPFLEALMLMFYVEIELDGVLCAKRCPRYKTPEGFSDHVAIRQHFTDLGYKVGRIDAVR